MNVCNTYLLCVAKKSGKLISYPTIYLYVGGMILGKYCKANIRLFTECLRNAMRQCCGSTKIHRTSIAYRWLQGEASENEPQASLGFQTYQIKPNFRFPVRPASLRLRTSL